MKALNSIGEKAPPYNKIEILNDKKGIPFVRINQEEIEDISVKISLSHCQDRSIALAITVRN